MLGLQSRKGITYLVTLLPLLFIVNNRPLNHHKLVPRIHLGDQTTFKAPNMKAHQGRFVSDYADEAKYAGLKTQ